MYLDKYISFRKTATLPDVPHQNLYSSPTADTCREPELITMVSSNLWRVLWSELHRPKSHDLIISITVWYHRLLAARRHVLANKQNVCKSPNMVTCNRITAQLGTLSPGCWLVETPDFWRVTGVWTSFWYSATCIKHIRSLINYCNRPTMLLTLTWA